MDAHYGSVSDVTEKADGINMGKGKRLRGQHKMDMLQKHFQKMQQQEAIKRAFAMTPIARAVKGICHRMRGAA